MKKNYNKVNSSSFTKWFLERSIYGKCQILTPKNKNTQNKKNPRTITRKIPLKKTNIYPYL